MSSAQALVLRLQEKGVELWAENDQLRYRAAKGTVIPQDLEEMRSLKAQVLEFLRSVRTSGALPPLTPQPRGAALPTSYAQQRLWFADQLSQGTGAYNIFVSVRLDPRIQADILQASLQRVVERHEALRTAFRMEEGELRQIIEPTVRFELPVLQIEAGPGASVELADIARREAHRAFDLTRAPLLRALLVRIGTESPALLLTVHHIVADGWSMDVLTREVIALYEAYSEGREDPLQPLRIQYADYTLWQRTWLQGALLQGQLKFWERQLAGAIPVELPLDRPRPLRRSYQGGVQSFTLSGEISAGLSELARSEGATPYMVLMAAFQVLLARVSGQQDIVVASPIAGRTQRETEPLIGFFVNLLLLRTQVEDGLTFRELLARLKDTALNAYANQEVPFDQAVAGVSEGRSERAGGLARVSFVLQSTGQPRAAVSAETQADSQVIASVPMTGTAKTDLLLAMTEGVGALQGAFSYATDLFDASTIETLAHRFIRTLELIVAAPDARLIDLDLRLLDRAAQASTERKLSTNQQMMWVDLQAHPERGTFYNILANMEIESVLDRSLFERALQHVVDCTSALRLEFVSGRDGLLTQRILPKRKVALSYIDFTEYDDPTAAMQSWFKEQQQRRIDPVREAPHQHVLYKISPTRFGWSALYHHLMMDGISSIMVRTRVGATYTALVRGETPPSNFDDAAYLEYLHLESEYRYSAQYNADRRHWLTELNDVPSVSLSVKKNTSPTGDPHQVRRHFSAELEGELRACAERVQMSYPRFMIAAAALYFGKVTGKQSLCVGLPTHGRFEPVARELTGAFTNILPVAFHTRRDMPLQTFVRDAARRLKSAFDHGRLRYEEIRRLLGLGPQSRALFDITINALPFENAKFAGVPSMVYTEPRHEQGLLFWILFSPKENYLTVCLYANPQLYEPWEVEAHVQRFEWFLKELVGRMPDESCTIGDLPLTSMAERCETVQTFNAAHQPYPRETLLHELFEEQVRRAPNATAVIHRTERLSYAELDARANQVARYLRECDVGPDALVGLGVERSIEMVVGLLGILKAGGAYVPLDPTYPRERLEYTLADASPRVVLTQGGVRRSLPETSAQVIELDTQWQEIASRPTTPLRTSDVGVRPEHLAYVIYTSGSTGRPKGVMVEHGSVVNYTLAARELFAVGAGDRVLQQNTLNFDLSIEEIFPAWVGGAALILSERTFGLQESAEADERPNVVHLTTAHWNTLVGDWAHAPQRASEALDGVRLINVTGDVLQPEKLAQWDALNVTTELVNTYGPTETTVSCTAERVVRGGASAGVSIGRPLHNLRIYILDEHREPVGIGMVGEIYIGGIGVARGYLNQPELTAQRFLTDSIADEEGARMYKSGDLARWRPDGTIEFLGRNDEQVKVRGFRIELGEIESQLSRHAAVKEAVVIVREDRAGEKRIVAYVTAADQAPTAEALRAHLCETLPEYMLPSAYVVLDRLPVTLNGKLDRRALPAPDEEALVARQYVEPVGEIEQSLAQIWQDVLQVPRVGRHDNFFELGGHSLLALAALNRMRTLGLQLPLVALFQHPTVEQLAAHVLCGGANALDDKTSIVLREGGDEPPLFLVHDLMGDVLSFFPLVRALPRSLPVIGLPLAEVAHLSSISALAARHVETIRSIRPRGPYRLAGHSFGGVVAYEIARQLAGDDDAVEFLGLIDSYVPSKQPREADSISDVTALLMQLRHRFPTLQREEMRKLSEQPDIEHLLAYCKGAGLLPPDLSVAQMQRWGSTCRAALQAYRSYSVERLGIAVHLFCAERPVGSALSHGWGPFVAKVHTIDTLRGTHESMLQDPNVALLAAEIVQSMREGQRAVDAAQRAYSPLMALQAVRPNSPKIFCVPGAGATIATFIPLVEALGSYGSTFGIQPRGLDGVLQPHTSVAGAARCYVEAIRRVQPRGPYRLIGHSFGGWVVFEMACLLAAEGETVMPVVLLDSRPPYRERIKSKHYTRVGALMKLICPMEAASGKRLGLRRTELERLDDRAQENKLVEAMRKAALLPQTTTSDSIRGLVRVFSTNMNTAYRPSASLAVPVELIEAIDPFEHDSDPEDEEIERENPVSSWDEHATHIRRIRVPGNHMTMLNRPHIDTVVRHILHAWEDSTTGLDRAGSKSPDTHTEKNALAVRRERVETGSRVDG